MPIDEEIQAKIDSEISSARNEIRTDKLDVSFGEIANLYKNGELKISPEYQRFFRWSSTQRSRFIESILLGFPTPAIFVAEDQSGIWELVDGLQRISSVLEFMGMLKDPKDSAGEKLLKPSALVKERHKPRLPSIEGVVFNQLSLQARLSIKRAGCRVEVIKIGSLQSMKYEVFERLNTGGSGLEPQEVRNCIFRSTNPGFIEWVDDLASFAPFQNNLGLSQKQKNTMYDKGLILRYLALKHAYNEFQHDVEPFITDFVRQVVEHDRPFDRNNEAETFRETFQMIADALGEDAWRHYRDGRHKGPLSVYIFEALAIGVAENLCSLKALSESSLKNRIIAFKQEDEFIKNTGAGANVKSKLRDRISFALSYFAKPEGS